MNAVFRLRAFFTLALMGGALAGCTNAPVPPCPAVRVDSSTARLTQFKDGPGRAVSDVEYQAELVAYTGSCAHSEKGVEVQMDIDVAVAGGPAAKKDQKPIYYFVAVPQLFPSTDGKRVFQLNRGLPSSPGTIERFKENDIRIFIPLKKDEPAAAYDVYVGLQLTNEQLDFNRSQRQ
jgi:hypothetical protein